MCFLKDVQVHFLYLHKNFDSASARVRQMKQSDPFQKDFAAVKAELAAAQAAAKNQVEFREELI